TTFLLTSFYWENFIFFGLGPKRGEDGVLAVTYPMGDKKLPSIAVEDIGKCAYGIFKRGGELVGQKWRSRGRAPNRPGNRRRLHASARRGGALQQRAAQGLPKL